MSSLWISYLFLSQQPGDRSCSNEAIGGNHDGPAIIYMAKYVVKKLFRCFVSLTGEYVEWTMPFPTTLAPPSGSRSLRQA